MSILHSIESLPRMLHPFHRDIVWTLPMMLHVLAARSHTPSTSPVLADALGILRRLVQRGVAACDALAGGRKLWMGSGAAAVVVAALKRAQRSAVARFCSPSVAVVVVAWCVFAVSHQRLHSLPAVAGTLPATVFLIGHVRRWLL
jgi:hypothetical protein